VIDAELVPHEVRKVLDRHFEVLDHSVVRALLPRVHTGRAVGTQQGVAHVARGDNARAWPVLLRRLDSFDGKEVRRPGLDWLAIAGEELPAERHGHPGSGIVGRAAAQPHQYARRPARGGVENELAGAKGRGHPRVALLLGQTMQPGGLAHFNYRCFAVQPSAARCNRSAKRIADAIDQVGARRQRIGKAFAAVRDRAGVGDNARKLREARGNGGRGLVGRKAPLEFIRRNQDAHKD
jgi:hypothetical protein